MNRDNKDYESALESGDGWIEWGGGECPVDGDVVVDVKYNGHDGVFTHTASTISWKHVWHLANIIAYRLHRDINSRANDNRLEQDLNSALIGPFNSIEECIAYAHKERGQDLNECIGQDMAPAWNGEGLPPVGTICEALMPALDNTLWRWRTVKVVESGTPGAEKEVLAYDIENTKPAWTDEFRPLRTEAEKSREADIKAMLGVVTNYNKTDVIHAIEQLYDAGYRKEVK